MVRPVRSQPLEAVEGKALRRYFKRDLRGGRLNEAAMRSDNNDTRRPILNTDAIVNALRFMFAQR